MRTRIMLTAMFAMALVIAPVASAMVYVDANLTTGANDGSSWENAFQGADAIAAAVSLGSGEDIWVAEGTYDGVVDVPSNTTLLGGFSNGDALVDRDFTAKVTIIDGANNDQCLAINTASPMSNVIVDGFTLQHGFSAGNGGGIVASNLDNTCFIRNLTITDCEALSGGGISLDPANGATVEDCVIDACHSGGGGGGARLYNTGGSIFQRVTVTNCYQADNGGGIFAGGNACTIKDCVIQDNVNTGIFLIGGAVTVTGTTIQGNGVTNWLASGMAAWTGTHTVTDCTFIDNTFDAGGGIGIGGGANITVTGCTFSANGGYNGCGGWVSQDSTGNFVDCMFIENVGAEVLKYSDQANGLVQNCLFAGNDTADTSGVFCHGTGTVNIVNCTMAGNTGGAAIRCLAGVTVNTLNVIASGNNPGGGTTDFVLDDATPVVSINYSLFENFPAGDPNPLTLGTGNLEDSAQFVNAAGGDYPRLALGSPGLDAGDSTDPLVPATDLLGDPRPGTVPGVSMGAYEETAALDPNEDEDSDGLTNGEEEALGTNPYLPDTDEDGYTDKQEVDAGTNPLDPLDFPGAGELPLSSGAVALLTLLALFGGMAAVKRAKNF